MTGEPPQPPSEGPPPPPELPGAPTPLHPASPDTWSLPPVPERYAPIPLPVSRDRRRLTRILAIVLMVVTVLVVIGFIGIAVFGRYSRYTIVSSSSTDGTFKAGNCVSLSTTRVTQADCGSAHDAQIIQVIHGKQTCPSGTEEFDVNDGTGNLCLDRANNSKG
jgi:hypothetical protein